MKIKWYGQSCFMITSEDGVKVLTDPFNAALGYKVPEFNADIVSISHAHKDHSNTKAVKDNFILIDKSGVFTEMGMEIKGVETFHDKVSGAKRGKNIIYNFKIDGINVCHCGDLGHILNSSQIDQIGKVDVMLIPVGGLFTINPIDAVKVVEQLNPKIIIPMHYRTKALGLKGHVFQKVDSFISASRLNAKEYDELSISKEDIKDRSEIAVLRYE